jgi:hypothetical protein
MAGGTANLGDHPKRQGIRLLRREAPPDEQNVMTVFREFTGIRGQVFTHPEFSAPGQRYRDILRRKKGK